ncbi:MAG: GNAT family N-acetyltransferase [Bacteroidota bacterium]
MYQIQSERLILMALSCEEVTILSESRNKLESFLGLNFSNLQLNADDSFLEELSTAITEFILPMVKANQDHFQWFTQWLIVNKLENITIGGIGCNGLPDKNGEVMIGYYIDKKYENKGYATEATSCLIQWMSENPDLKSIIADTLPDGIQSQKVLQKAGFKLLGSVEEGIRWIYSK